MKITETTLPDVLIIEPTVFTDERGFFFESFQQEKFNKAIGQKIEFVQDNHSRSKQHVLRGLHFQVPPYPQGKLVRVTSGKVLDVAVDIRLNSPTFGQWVSVELSGQNHKQLWIPKGFAHGFVVLSEEADFLYKTTHFWNRECERAIVWNDPDIAIDWQLGQAKPLMTEKDLNAPRLQEWIKECKHKQLII